MLTAYPSKKAFIDLDGYYQAIADITTENARRLRGADAGSAGPVSGRQGCLVLD